MMRYLIGLLFIVQPALAQWPVVSLKTTQQYWKFFSDENQILVPVVVGRKILVPTALIEHSQTLSVSIKKGASEFHVTLGQPVKKGEDTDNRPYFTAFTLPNTLGDLKEANVVDVKPGDRLLVITYDHDRIVACGGVVSAKLGEGILTDAVEPGVQGVAVTPSGGLVGLVVPPPDDIETHMAYVRRFPDIKAIAMK